MFNEIQREAFSVCAGMGLRLWFCICLCANLITRPSDVPAYKTDNSTYLLTYLLHAAGSFLRSSQVVKQFPAFYGTLRFNTAFTSARYVPLY
jgi:hypothetical protein